MPRPMRVWPMMMVRRARIAEKISPTGCIPYLLSAFALVVISAAPARVRASAVRHRYRDLLKGTSPLTKVVVRVRLGHG